MRKDHKEKKTFSERNANTLPPPAKGRANYRCASGPTGFRLVITAAGARSYFLIYRSRANARRAYRIGPTKDLSFKEAKDRAEILRGQVAAGGDPFLEEQDRRQAATAEVLTVRRALSYFIAHRRSRLDPKTVEFYEQTLEALPRRFLDLHAESVKPSDFRDAMKDTTSAPTAQHNHLARLKASLRFAAAEHGLNHLPPLLGMSRPHPAKRRTRVLTHDEIRVMWKALDTVAPLMPRGGIAFAARVRLMLLVGTRFTETTLATWEEFDLDAPQPVWNIPAEHRKGMKHRKQGLTVPLAPLAVSILRELRRTTGERPLVFWKAGESARIYMMNRLIDEMGKQGHGAHWTIHDERRTCATGLGELNCPQELIDLCLGHVRKGVIATYDHSMRLSERAEWLTRWADRVAGFVTT